MKKLLFLISTILTTLFASCGEKTYTITVDDTDFAEYNSIKIIELDKYEKIQNSYTFFGSQSKEYTACPETVEINVRAIGPGYLGVEMPIVNKSFKLKGGRNDIHISMKDDNTLEEIKRAF